MNLCEKKENNNNGMKIMNNKTVKLLQEHRSIRKYTDKPIADFILENILKSAQWAPSSHNVQAYSIIVVKNQSIKKEISEICKSQKWIIECPVFLVFTADFYRLKNCSVMNGKPFYNEEIENLLVGSIDTALAAQNAFIAAKSYGLGGVFIGGVRRNPKRMTELLRLPEYVIPLFGMCLGYPLIDEIPCQKPRLPKHGVIHEETYKTENTTECLKEYERISSDYYTRRTNGMRTEGWTKQMAEYFSEPRQPHLKSFLLDQKIGLN